MSGGSGATTVAARVRMNAAGSSRADQQSLPGSTEDSSTAVDSHMGGQADPASDVVISGMFPGGSSGEHSDGMGGAITRTLGLR